MSIYLGEGKTIYDYSAMRGPCDEGFHVPLSTEWQAIYDAGVSLGAWTSSGCTNLITYLKLPMSGCRSYDSSASNTGSIGFYWSSSKRNDKYAYCIAFYSSEIYPNTDFNISQGQTIRCFKDTPTEPTSDWTVLYQGAGSAGIYHDSTNGLISISSDGTTWYTIMDKNLGATTVYNYGDTLSVSNTGNVFQWGNNYAFPGPYSSDSITTSSSTVNASTYGPGNYYSSSTWVTPMPWESSNNTNLRGGETGVVQKESTGIKEVYLGEGKTIVLSDMQGPAPEGFHVPLSTEWQGLQTIMTSLSLTTGDSWRTNLHIPFAGARRYSSAALYDQGSYGYYWSSSPYGSDRPYYARYFYVSSSNAYEHSNYRAYGFSVRCFKDSFELPTPSWTVINGTLGSAGIFWNQTEGLISITSDGTTGYTIQDKNIGATTVYNNGDTLSQSNCGKYYQWGNNYGFDWTGSITTSGTKVNAQNYGPGNYYESSTFIYGSTNWDSSNNDNLRGGTSQGSSTIVKTGIKEAYIGTTKVYPKE